MEKKCESCGKEFEGEKWMHVCPDCYKKTRDEKRETKENKKDNSIERQVAAKCVAAIYQGRVVEDSAIEQRFNLFLRLIRGD